MQQGEEIQLDGFITQALYVRGQTSGEVERRLGYRMGRLDAGWFLLFLTELPGIDDFEFRGYSQSSGGVSQGHLRNPPDPRNAHQRLAAGGYDLQRLKADIITTKFRVLGPDRLAKVLPVKAAFGEADYPPGTGIPQWTLTHKKRFSVAASVHPGEVYNGNYQ